MNYNIATLQVFEKQAKRLEKKFPSLKNDLEKLIDSLIKNPFQGASIGNIFFKIRPAISSKGKGKSV